MNHPGVDHRCEDAAVLDPTTLPAHELLLASPSCTGHTHARGVDRPHHDAARATAWCVLRVVEAKRPRAVIVENVPEMLAWAGYRGWRLALTDYGYRVSEQVIDAADVGVAQHRKRLFVVATRTRRPLWITPPSAPHIAVRGVLDLEGGEWSLVEREGRSPRTLARIAEGRRKHGDEFLVAYYSAELGGRSLDRPIGTFTTHDRYAIVRGDKMRMLTVAEMLRASGFPEAYQLTGTRSERVMQIGNAVVPPVARYVVRSVLEGVS